MFLKFGIVCNTKPGYAKVHLLEEDIVTDWLSIITRRAKDDKDSWQYEINEQVVCIMFNDCDDGIIIGARHNDEDKPDEDAAPSKFRMIFSDGTLLEYNKESHDLKAIIKGNLHATVQEMATIEAKNIICKADESAIVEANEISLKGEITIKGKVLIEGDIECSGGIQANQIKAGIVDLSTHKHIGVQPGGGTSGTPI